MTMIAPREKVAKAICRACDETPEHQGDCRGNRYRWQDYLPIADAAIDAYRRNIVHPWPTDEDVTP